MSGRIPRLRVQNLSMEFGGLKAVSNFSCEIYDGELLGLIGPNGAGKTTIFNMLSGIYSPSGGSIEFRDRQGNIHLTGKYRACDLNRIGIARTFQNIRLFPKLTAEDNILIAMHSGRAINPLDALFRTRRYYEDEERLLQRSRELLSLFKIEKKNHELACNLPYGEQRKLEIARALASNPSLLLLDEPAAGMNPQETEELKKLIALICNQFNLTVFLIEHDMRMVMGICERLMVLDYGRSIAEGTPAEIRNNPAVIKAYLGAEAVNG